jgi:hypothetical protein
MEKTLQVLNEMVRDGVIEQYAIGGAVAAIFYIEPINTNDLDIFFHVKEQKSGLDILAPLYSYLANLGYESYGETIEIEGWPVQFLPAFNSLIEEALEDAQEVKFQTTKTRVLRPEHLMAIMLQVGRLKDLVRLSQFVEIGKFQLEKLEGILTRHELLGKWNEFGGK